jgi:hypothetical protein
MPNGSIEKKILLYKGENNEQSNWNRSRNHKFLRSRY